MTGVSAEDRAALRARAEAHPFLMTVNPATVLALLDLVDALDTGERDAFWRDDTLRAHIKTLTDEYEAVHGDEDQDSPRLGRYAAAYREVVADLRAAIDPANPITSIPLTVNIDGRPGGNWLQVRRGDELIIEGLLLRDPNAATALVAVDQLHQADDTGKACDGCGLGWPCKTRRLLDAGDEPPAPTPTLPDPGREEWIGFFGRGGPPSWWPNWLLSKEDRR
jgi:hypothetical protein